MRVSDGDREAAVELLRQAMAEGRLTLVEFDDRLARAYRSVTYADVDELFADLPRRGLSWPSTTAAPLAVPTPAATVPTRAPGPAGPAPYVPRGPEPLVPTWLKILWIVWSTIIIISLVVWTLTSVGNGEPDSFWPQWVAGPPVAIIAGLSAIVIAIRRGRRGH